MFALRFENILNADDFRALVLPHLPEDKDCKILDFGCGEGRLLELMAQKGYRSLTGYDRNPMSAASESINFICKEDWRSFLASNSALFDRILLKDVIYYFDSREAIDLLRALRSSLTKDGQLLVEIFNGAQFLGSYPMHKDPHIRMVYNDRGLQRILEEAGLRIVEIRGYDGFKITGIRSLLRCLLFYPVRMLLWALYFAERGSDPENPRFLTRKIFAVAESK